MILEVCANSLSSAMTAQNAGAHRVELCQNLWCGGTTPSAATIEWTRQNLQIDLFVLIRPRSGDFCYTEWEYKVIQREVLWCKDAGVDGVVVGILTPEGNIDIPRMQHLLRLAHPMELTFHRAFDFVAEPFKAIDQLKNIGISRILTSGGAATAWEGKNRIKQLIETTEGEISIMAGGGINTDNIVSLVKETGLQEVHLSGKH